MRLRENNCKETCGAREHAGYPIRSLNENWYQDFSLSARAWIGTDGMAYVAFATNAAGGGPDTDQCMVLTSLENIYQLK